MTRYLGWAITLWLVASVAHAQPATPHEPTAAELTEARHSFDVATRAFEAGDYETAASEFRAALDLSGAPDLLFNIYLSEERQGHLEPAAEALDQYLQRGTVDAEQRALLTGRLERVRARIAVRTPTHEVAPDEPQTLHASPIAAVTLPEPTPEPPAAPPPRITTSPPIVPIVMLGVAGALAVTFGVFAGLAHSENDRLTSACARVCTSSQVATLNTYDVVADVSWISAAAIGVAGLVLFFVLPSDTHEEPSAPRVAVAPWISPLGAGLSIGGRL